MARYLLSEHKNEPAPENLRSHVPEVSIVEFHLERIIEKLQEMSGVETDLYFQSRKPGQIGLFSVTPVETAINLSHIPTPSKITDMRIGKSEQAPLILWALVALKAAGQDWSDGVTITKVINERLVDDYHKKAPNNISRALRSDSIQRLSWLKTKSVSQRKKLFGLAENWSEAWREVFEEPAPQI